MTDLAVNKVTEAYPAVVQAAVDVALVEPNRKIEILFQALLKYADKSTTDTDIAFNALNEVGVMAGENPYMAAEYRAAREVEALKQADSTE